MATGAARRGRSGRRGRGRRSWSPAVLRETGGARLLCSAVVWLGLNVAAWSRLFEPLPDISAWAWLALAALATLGAGVLAGRRLLVVLAVAPPLIAAADGFTSRSDAGATLPILAGVAAAALLASGVMCSRVVPLRVAIIAGACLLAAPLPLIGWAAERTFWPQIARPAHPLRVDLAAGSFRGVSLGQSLTEARRAWPAAAETSAVLPAPLDAPSAPLGVSYVPADATSVRARGRSLLAEHGRVVALFITDLRAEAIAGVGVGDNLGVARERLRGLVCARSSAGDPTCAGRLAHHTVLLVGDPIETIALSDIDTGWCLVRSASCRRPDPAVAISAR